MEDRKAETEYLRRRVSDSLAMAAAATHPCARIAHLTLARLYDEAIDTLIARAERPTFHALYTNAAASEGANTHGCVAPQTTFMLSNLVESEQQLAFKLLS